MREDATRELPGAVGWQVLDLPQRNDVTDGASDLVLANEYLDALPVHRVVQDGGLHESFVGWVDGWFTERIDEPACPKLEEWLADDRVSLREGQRAEICLGLRDWMDRAAASLGPGGVLLVIDYGHDADELYGERRMAGSLLTYRGHQVGDDPFEAVGRSDITSHVDITALRRCADAAGLQQLGSTTQAQFLVQLGLGDELSRLGRQPGAEMAEYVAARAAVVRLLDPRHLGGFRVLAWARPRLDGTLPTVPGFRAGP